jgi:DNA-binding transcriptional LysR family regulator
VIVPIRDNIPERRIYLQWNRNRYMSPAAKYFRDYIVRSGDVFDQYRKQHNLI